MSKRRKYFHICHYYNISETDQFSRWCEFFKEGLRLGLKDTEAANFQVRYYASYRCQGADWMTAIRLSAKDR